MSPSQVPLSVTVLGEARELLSVLRQNRRFGYLLSFTAASHPAEHPLVKEVKSLRDVVRVIPANTPSEDATIPPPNGMLIPPDALLSALDPFLEVVKSRDASGIITGVALLSLDRITTRLLTLADTYDLMTQYAVAFSAIVDAAAACRFDATDPAADEVVLARICSVIARITTSLALPLIPDASILRAVEACLRIAAGRRRASDLLKRTADATLVNIFTAIGHNLLTICDPTMPASTPAKDRTSPPSLIADGVNGPVFGYSLDTDSFAQHGSASADVVAALVELCARMSDPTLATSHPERSLGMQLLSAILGSAGSNFRQYPPLKSLLMRHCSRAILRSLGMFQSQPATISAAFTVAIKLVHVLEEDGAPFLLALLERVFPYYISGYENVLPLVKHDSDLNGITESAKGNGHANGSPPGSGNGTVGPGTVEIDPFVREIGLEAFAALLSSPRLLCVVYRIADCDLSRRDVVSPLLKALGYAAKTKRSRRRSKRLRASSSGANHVASAATDVDSDDDDTDLTGGSGTTESSRFSRAAALLCAESILAIVDTINERLKLQSDGSVQNPDGNQELLLASRKLRQEKAKIQHAAIVFNSSEKLEKATRLLLMLKDHGLASTTTDVAGTVNEDFDGDVQAIVKFLRKTPGLNKQRIGVIIGEPDTLSRRILADYTATFEFADRPFTESLRVFLESFRLPGEAQKIDRIVQSFAERYCEQNKPHADSLQESTAQNGEVANGTTNGHSSEEEQEGRNRVPPTSTTSPTEDGKHHHHRMGVLKNADAAYILSYSVVMLNTDQHNDSIRKKMTLEEFFRNSRGINGGEDLPKWFLADIFNSIAAVEIKMSDEAGIGALTDVHWDEQLRQMNNKTLPSMESLQEFNEEVFTLAWEPAVVAANAILNEAGDANSVQKALEGFLAVARCATAYRMGRPTDAVISSLTTATTLREGPLHGAIVRFGTDIKAQMASVALSGVSRQCADWLETDGWQSLVAYLLRLHALGLLPAQLEQQVGGNGAELVGVGRQELPPSKLVPAWWPSQTERHAGSKSEEERPRKSSRPNGFLAALIAASIGPEMDSEEEDEYGSMHATNSLGRVIRKTSNAPPYYLRMRSPEEREAQELARKCIAGCRIEDVIINEAKVLQSSALEHLANAIARSAIRTMGGGEASADSDAGDDDRVNATEGSLLDWNEIAPLSPRGDSSAVVGVSNKYRALVSTDSESDFSSFGLASPWTGQVRERDERKARNFVAAFCIDLLCELTLQNRDRLHLPWPALHGLLVRVIAPATQPSAVLERAVVCLLRVGVRLLHREELRDDVLRGLNLLVRLPLDTAEVLSVPIAAGVYNIVKTHGSGIRSTSGWHAILSIIESSARYQPEAREIGLSTISCLLQDQSSPDGVSAETFTPLLHAILAYTSCTSVDISIRALDLLFLLSQRIASFSKTPNSEINSRSNRNPVLDASRADSEVWSEFWGPLFLGFASSVRDARGKVRNSALGVLERVVASSESAEFLSAEQWNRALATVLLPLMTQLFTTHGFLEATLEAEQSAQKKLLAERNATATATRGRMRNVATSTEHQEQLRHSVAAACNRTRMRAVQLTSKTFLQHHLAIASGISEETFTELWIGVLEVFRVAIENGVSEFSKRGTVAEKHDDLVEHIPENVKNLLLVMCDCGLLKADQQVRWNATFAVVRNFVPDMEEIISAATSDPLPNKQEEASSVTATHSVPDSSDIPVNLKEESSGLTNSAAATSISVASST